MLIQIYATVEETSQSQELLNIFYVRLDRVVGINVYSGMFHLIGCVYGKKTHLEYALEKLQNPYGLK